MDTENDFEEVIEHSKPSVRGVGGEQMEQVLLQNGIEPDGNGAVISEQPEQREYFNDDGTVNSSVVYKRLANLIVKSENVIDNFTYLDPNAEGVLSGMASVMMSLKQIMSEFTKIHTQDIKHKQALALEHEKEASKKRLLEYKHKLDLEKIRLANGVTDEPEQDKLKYNQTSLVQSVLDARNKVLPQ